MKLLIDESLPQAVAHLLAEEGHDALDVADVGLRGCPDVDILARAADEDRVVVTADTDFGTLLALSGAAGPSVLLLRRTGRRAPERARVLLTVLGLVTDQLMAGAIVTVDQEQVRVRILPVKR